MKWQVIKTPLGFHTVPLEDSLEHQVLTPCWCRPTTDTEHENVIIHHSMLPDDEDTQEYPMTQH